MSEGNADGTAVTPEPLPEGQPAQPEKASSTLMTEVAELIKNSTSTVRLRVRDLLVERKVAERVEMLDKGLKMLGDAKSELNKIRPDIISYSGDDGKQKNESWSKDQLEKRNKAREQQMKIEKAVEMALGGNFEKLRELAK